MRINVHLPGPFSISVRAPSPTRAVRAAAQLLREDRARMVAVKREVPAFRHTPRPIQRGSADLDLGVAILWGVVVTTLLALLIAWLT